MYDHVHLDAVVGIGLITALPIWNLAGQTAKATAEIDARISAVQRATDEAVSAIGGIASTIGRMNEISGSIACASEGTRDANDNILHSLVAISRIRAWKESPMRKLIFESIIFVPEGDTVLDQICHKLIGLCMGTSRNKMDLCLIFEVGRSIIRVGHGALLMRVEADDLVGCHSMKVALEGTVVEIFGLKQPSILWIATNSEPFAALAVHPIRPRI